ncbi:hypothetical protein IQ266_00775 [filamentous cyanobacterium LEGE 11480]|uniref:Transferase n=1 Tax=Romeriopsis navalis LEGE 11480 TaxID=2777977 RepID=A0A928VGR2_9CYAN|nr:hypothetical protein [Romeriopsis navalis]MBE9028288.1 hypothetical protein [Romeriopsis navalis LEGE 11480]
MTSTPFHLEPIHTDQYVVTGDVAIAEGVAIAPGVLLQADAGSRIILGSGVCLGMGCVIHANRGEIRVEAGVNLGAGVLVVGTAHIGPGAIVGAGSTVFSQSIDAGQLVAPNSLLVNQPAVGHQPEPPAKPVEVPAAVPGPQAKPESEIPKVNVDGHSFFYGKGSSKSPAVEDPWATTPATPNQPNASEPLPSFDPNPKFSQIPDITPQASEPPQSTPNQPSASEPLPSFDPNPKFSNIPDLTPQDTEAPVTSTFVYPDGNCLPKHAWQTSSEANLGGFNDPNPVTHPVGETISVTPQPNPDSDLSAEEMQGRGIAPPPTDNSGGSLVTHTPKQVYGQAYVNQMLGRMTGKKF